jgi:hypothetical protein
LNRQDAKAAKKIIQIEPQRRRENRERLSTQPEWGGVWFRIRSFLFGYFSYFLRVLAVDIFLNFFAALASWRG